MSVNKTKSYAQQIHALAWPMILSAISIPLLGIVDTTILGHLHKAEFLAAVNVGASGVNMLLWLLGFLRMSTTGLVAQAVGGGQSKTIYQHLIRSFILALILALSIIFLLYPISQLIIYVLADGGEVADLAQDYLFIRLWATPFSLLLFVIYGYLIALGKVRSVLVITLISQLGNVLLDLLFVLYFNMDVKGVAWGSLISEFLAFVYALKFIYAPLSKYFTAELKQLIQSGLSGLTAYLVLNRDIFIRTLCLIYVFGFITRQSANQGEVIQAANAVLINFFYLASYALDGYAHAIESLSGRLFGSKSISKLQSAIKTVFKISFVMALLICLIYWLFGELFIRLMTDLEAVRAQAIDHLWWLIWLPLIAFTSFVYDGLCIGLTLSKLMRNSMLISTLLIYLPAGFIFYHQILPNHNNHLLWLCFVLFFILRSVVIHLGFQKHILLHYKTQPSRGKN